MRTDDTRFIWHRLWIFGGGAQVSPCATAKILYLGVLAAVLPCVMFVIGQGKAYWMEWSTVGVFMLYILAVGRQSQALKQRVHAFV
jgi:peptidoglycan/LPS O-acetylase OafA/YrhL